MQNNISFNDAVGTTRGIHAEPWDKWVSVATGRIFGAWVDLREGPTFGAVFTTELDPSRAIFVPRGVGNSYQTLEPDTAYTYLVNDHWSPDADVLLPEPRRRDRRHRVAHPPGARSRSRRRTSRTRAWPTSPRSRRARPWSWAPDGQLGRALRARVRRRRAHRVRDPRRPRHHRPGPARPHAGGATTTPSSTRPRTPPSTPPKPPTGAPHAWAANATGVAALARDRRRERHHPGARLQRLRLRRRRRPAPTPRATRSARSASTDRRRPPATPPSRPRPATTSSAPRWVIGEGNNFVRTMASLAERGIDPARRRRPDRAPHLHGGHRRAASVTSSTPDARYGTYNLTGAGEPTTWADIARARLSSSPATTRHVSPA